MQIKLNVSEHLLTLAGTSMLAGGSENVDTIKVTFDSTWNGFGKLAVFNTEKTDSTNVAIDTDGIATIPSLKSKKYLRIGIVGIKNEQTYTTNVIKVYVEEGAVKSESEAPAADVYHQILSMFGEISAALDNINIVAGMSQSQTVLRTVTRKKATSVNTTEYNKITNYSDWSKYQFILVEFWIDNNNNNKREYDTTLLIPTSVINDTKFFCLSQSEHTTDIGVGHANLKFNIDFSSNTILQYIITATDNWKDFLYSFCIYGIGNKISSLSDLDGNGVSY